MAILNFQKPDKIILQKATDFEAQFEFRPLEPGYGVTIGNALRRVLLNSLEGYAIVGVKIEGVDHEFATMKGISEDVVEIFLNLKQVPFKLHSNEPKTLRISKDGAGEVTAADIETDADVDEMKDKIRQGGEVEYWKVLERIKVVRAKG